MGGWTSDQVLPPASRQDHGFRRSSRAADEGRRRGSGPSRTFTRWRHVGWEIDLVVSLVRLIGKQVAFDVVRFQVAFDIVRFQVAFDIVWKQVPLTWRQDALQAVRRGFAECEVPVPVNPHSPRKTRRRAERKTRTRAERKTRRSGKRRKREQKKRKTEEEEEEEKTTTKKKRGAR